MEMGAGWRRVKEKVKLLPAVDGLFVAAKV